MQRFSLSLLIVAMLTTSALAQDKGTLEPRVLPPLANPQDPKTPARDLFGRKTVARTATPHVIGFYSKGCIDGAKALPINGETWQVMRLSRNRNWGHPQLIALLQRLSQKAPKVGYGPGILVGDISQPRGGPMLTGHASHQIGLDADIWLTPMPNRELTRLEREETSATMMVAKSRKDIEPQDWTPGQLGIVRAAAEEPAVERIFVNAAIKKAMCRDAQGSRSWLRKVRPMWGHDYHFHVRIGCPEGQRDCKPQEPVGDGEGCGSELDWWFRDSVLFPKPAETPPPKPRPITMADLPNACRAVALAP